MDYECNLWFASGFCLIQTENIRQFTQFLGYFMSFFGYVTYSTCKEP